MLPDKFTMFSLYERFAYVSASREASIVYTRRKFKRALSESLACGRLTDPVAYIECHISAKAKMSTAGKAMHCADGIGGNTDLLPKITAANAQAISGLAYAAVIIADRRIHDPATNRHTCDYAKIIRKQHRAIIFPLLRD